MAHLKFLNEGNGEGESFAGSSSCFDDDVVSGHAFRHCLVLWEENGKGRIKRETK